MSGRQRSVKIGRKAMKILLGRRKAPSRFQEQHGVELSVQDAPIELQDEVGTVPLRLKVDVALRIGRKLIVSGWSTGPLQLDLCDGASDIGAAVARFPRTDVASHIGLDPDMKVGFLLFGDANPASEVRIRWSSRQPVRVNRFSDST